MAHRLELGRATAVPACAHFDSFSNIIIILKHSNRDFFNQNYPKILKCVINHLVVLTASVKDELVYYYFEGQTPAKSGFGHFAAGVYAALELAVQLLGFLALETSEQFLHPEPGVRGCERKDGLQGPCVQ